MDAAVCERVYEAFQDFHAYFSPLFGRRESRERSGDYLQAVLVQFQDRRNAENLSESVGVSARGMQRFLTDAPWDDDVVLGRLQEYLGSPLGHPEAVWVAGDDAFGMSPSFWEGLSALGMRYVLTDSRHSKAGTVPDRLFSRKGDQGYRRTPAEHCYRH